MGVVEDNGRAQNASTARVTSITEFSDSLRWGL